MNRLLEKPWFPWLLCGLLATAALGAYLPSFRGGFVFDDIAHIIQNEQIRSLSTLAPGLASNNRPVVFFTLWLNYQVGGTDRVFGYHVLNFAVHLFAGLTLFGLVRRTLRLPRPSEDGQTSLSAAAPRTARWADPIAFAVALLWLIHPLQTQAVTYIIQRCESMMGMFYLLALYCVLRGAQSAKPRWWYLAGIAAGWLGMGCKEVMITAPVVILLFDRIFLSGSWRTVFRRRWGFYLAWAPAIVWLVITTIGRAPEVQSESMAAPTPLEYLSSQPAILLHYLRLAVLPDQLCFDYQWPVMRNWTQIALPGSVILALFAAAVVALIYRPRVGFLAASCFVVLAPTSSIQPITDLAVEHRMYLPLALLMAMGVLGATTIVRRVLRLRRRRAIIYAATLLVLAGMWSARTYVRNLLYTKPDALWANALQVAPNNPRAANNLGCHFAAAGQVDHAIAYFQKSLELDPTFYIAYCNMARGYAKKGDLATGVAILRKGMEIAPAAMLHSELGELLEKQGHTAEAMAEYRQALELEPRSGRTHYRLARLLTSVGKLEEAIGHYRTALEIRPKEVACIFRLGVAYQRRGDFVQAMELYGRALELNPNLQIARCNLELCQAGRRDVERLPEEGNTKPNKTAPEQPKGGR